MCGRAFFKSTANELSARYKFAASAESSDYHPKVNAGPGSTIPVLVSEQTSHVIKYAKWGLIPSYHKGEKLDYFRAFNCRSESMHEKALFRGPLATCRCVLLVDGYFEWTLQSGVKQPYFIREKDEEPFMIAGLYTCITINGKVEITSTMLTCGASPVLAEVHHRRYN